MTETTEKTAVLVIEDEDRLRELMVRRIEAMGYDARGSRTAEDGLKQMADSPADIVLLDLNLPVMSGMECLEVLAEKWPQTSVIIMTGFGDLESAQRAIRLGVVDFLTKPCHLGDIERALDSARRRHRDPNALPTASAEALAENRNTEPPVDRDDEAPLNAEDPLTLEELQKRAILRAYERHKGNRTKISEELGITRRTLYNHLVRYGIQGHE